MKKAGRILTVFICVAALICTVFAIPAFAESITVVIEEGVNIRNAPTTVNSTILYCTPTYVTATSDSTAYDEIGRKWYHVTLPNGIVGYACGDYVTEGTSGGGGQPPSTDNSGFYPSVFDGNRRLVMVTDSVNVRQQPTTASTAIAAAWPCVLETRGSTVNSYGEKWYNVITPGGLNGYIRSDFIAEYTYTYDEAFEESIKQFPLSYRDGLRYLHTRFPKWKFYADNLSITLEYAASMEAGRKIISNEYTSLPEKWRTSSGIATLEPGYRHASTWAISYTMNPENFITPSGIFMFMQQSYDPTTQNKTSVKKVVNGTFLNSDEYIGYLIEAAEQSRVNPDILAGLIIHEQGSEGSALSLGKYPGYEGYYNFYNYSASGSTTKEIIENGLKYAKEKGWTTPRKAIIEGAVIYGQNYVNSGQYTHYYKDFNVINQHWYFQYATGLFDQINNAVQIAAGYLDHDSSVSFRIPVYAGSNFGGHNHTWSENEYDDEVHFDRCTECDVRRNQAPHIFSEWDIAISPESGYINYERHCTVCGKTETKITVTGSKNPDVNGDGKVDDKDAVYLLFHSFYGDLYPITGDVDYNDDGFIDDKDAIYLLFHIFFPDGYPIK